MGESPRWHDGRFWMCDWLAGEVLAFAAAGEREVVARVDGLPFSIDWLPDGRLVVTTPAGVVAGPDLAPYGAAGSRSTRSWSTRRANAGWTCPARCRGRSRSPASSRSCAGRVEPRSSPTTCGSPTAWRSSTRTTLVVAESHADRLTAWTITETATLTDRRVWADLGPGAGAGRHLRRRVRGDLVRLASRAALRPGGRGRRGARDGRGRPRLLLVHARRRRRPHALHRGEPLRSQRRLGRRRAHRTGSTFRTPAGPDPL